MRRWPTGAGPLGQAGALAEDQMKTQVSTSSARSSLRLALRRDEGASRLRRLTTLVSFGAAGLVGILSLLVSHALPGRPAGGVLPAGPRGATEHGVSPVSTGAAPSRAGTSRGAAPLLRPPSAPPSSVALPSTEDPAPTAPTTLPPSTTPPAAALPATTMPPTTTPAPVPVLSGGS